MERFREHTEQLPVTLLKVEVVSVMGGTEEVYTSSRKWRGHRARPFIAAGEGAKAALSAYAWLQSE